MLIPTMITVTIAMIMINYDIGKIKNRYSAQSQPSQTATITNLVIIKLLCC